MPELEDYWRAMRAIMYQPTEVWLITDKQDDRWLTDQFVMLKITDAEEFLLLPDGAYKLTVSKGPEARDSKATFDLDEWFVSVNHRDWHLAEPTMWSVIEEYNGKAHAWNAEGVPALLGEPTWAAIKRYYPEVVPEHSWRGNSIFRFSAPEHNNACEVEEDGTYRCLCRPVPFAYAAGIKIPEGQEKVAERVVDPDSYTDRWEAA